MRRLEGAIVLLGLLAVAAVVWWRWGDDLQRLAARWRGETSAAATVSPATAAQAEAKLERVRTAGDTVALSAAELTSLLRYRLAPRLPLPLDSAEVQLRGDTVQLRARLPMAALPRSRDIDAARAVLSDTAEIEIRGRIVPAGPNEAAFDIVAARVAGVSVPRAWVPEGLARLGRPPRTDLPSTAYPVRLPPGVGAARSARDSLYLYPATSTVTP
jgi:hypothetical protein